MADVIPSSTMRDLERDADAGGVGEDECGDGSGDGDGDGDGDGIGRIGVGDGVGDIKGIDTGKPECVFFSSSAAVCTEASGACVRRERVLTSREARAENAGSSTYCGT